GTEDGLAKAPYIRESRRIVAQKIVREQGVSRKANDVPPVFEDSVGVGHYAIDIHLTTKSHTFLYDSVYPFEIPLSAMIPIRLKNLIPACKNIGCTHLTNGCYRLHPVEWNIGEVAGLLSAYCIENSVTPLDVYQTNLKDFQKFIQAYGVQIHWDFDQMDL
ncbi:MAG: FAD-dependent oxidoreductase, partial [Turicibacter sp.]